jgi:DnaJ-class molecular chaperone
MDNNNDLECKKIINTKDYYEILGLDKNANDDEIRRAYKKLAIKYHPDKNKSNFAADAFKKVSHAFSVLSNPEKKANYDKYGTEEEIIERTNSGHFKYHDDMDPFVYYFKFFLNDNISYKLILSVLFIF